MIYEYKITEGVQELSGHGLEHKTFLDSEHGFGHGLGQSHHFEQGLGLELVESNTNKTLDVGLHGRTRTPIKSEPRTRIRTRVSDQL